MDFLITLFLAGDMMLGRGIDQILPHSVDPTLHESFVKNAVEYVRLAEAPSGPIERPVDFAYVWGDALDALRRHDPRVRIVNLETAVTTNDDFWPGKGIHYRMHPQNVQVLKAGEVDVAVLANNHVLDWGYEGLADTVGALGGAGIEPVGAGANLTKAREPAAIAAGEEQRVLVFGFAMPDSGVAPVWAAEPDKPGVAFLPRLDDDAVRATADAVAKHGRANDVVVFSVHWGGNWGYQIPREQIQFAHALIDRAGVDVVHGHSSHHVKGIDVYHDRLILYGAGDFLNDYEGIGGHEAYRPDLTVMYLPTVDARTGELQSLRLVPMQVRRMRLNRAGADDARWLKDRLNRESKPFGVRFEVTDEHELVADWTDAKEAR